MQNVTFLFKLKNKRSEKINVKYTKKGKPQPIGIIVSEGKTLECIIPKAVQYIGTKYFKL